MNVIRDNRKIKTDYVFGAYDVEGTFGFNKRCLKIQQGEPYKVTKPLPERIDEISLSTPKGIAEGYLNKRFRQPYKNELKELRK